MDYVETIVLATLQGLLEFLPISSSGHVFLVTKIFDWDDRGSLFDAVIHVGALSAILIYFGRIFLSVNPLKRWQLKFDENDAITLPRLIVLFIAALLPLVIGGSFYIVFRAEADEIFRTSRFVGGALVVTGVILLSTSFVKKNNTTLGEITIKNAVLIGLAQILSIIPGISRSGMVISMGIFNRLNYVTAARFSFLLAIPTLAGTGLEFVFEVFTEGFAESNISWLEFLIAFISSAIAALVSIYATLFILRRALLLPIATYAIIVGVSVVSLSFAFPTRFS